VKVLVRRKFYCHHISNFQPMRYLQKNHFQPNSSSSTYVTLLSFTCVPKLNAYRSMTIVSLLDKCRCKLAQPVHSCFAFCYSTCSCAWSDIITGPQLGLLYAPMIWDMLISVAGLTWNAFNSVAHFTILEGAGPCKHTGRRSNGLMLHG
jgi:hypothetical protein